MHQFNRGIKKLMSVSFAFLLAGIAMADPAPSPLPANNPVPPANGSSLTPNFPSLQSQSYQAMLQQLQQVQQAYINDNSLNPANYNLSPMPAPTPVPTPSPIPTPAPSPSAGPNPGGAIPLPSNAPNTNALTN